MIRAGPEGRRCYAEATRGVALETGAASSIRTKHRRSLHRRRLSNSRCFGNGRCPCIRTRPSKPTSQLKTLANTSLTAWRWSRKSMATAKTTLGVGMTARSSTNSNTEQTKKHIKNTRPKNHKNHIFQKTINIFLLVC